MEKGCERTLLDQIPTMPEMIKIQSRQRLINIVEEIGMNGLMVGTILLNDDSITYAIAQQCKFDNISINRDVLSHWLQRGGIHDRTWRRLLGVLRKANCVELAKSIEEALTEEEASQDSSTSVLGSDLPPMLVLVRVVDSEDSDFLEVEFAPPTYEALLSACCDELELQHSDVTKIYKLPDVLVKRDRDVQRLEHGQRIKVIRSDLPVLVRVAESEDSNFSEVEFAPPTYEALLSACCDELELQHSDVTKIYKLPDILVKRDRDVQRLEHGQRIKVIRSDLPLMLVLVRVAESEDSIFSEVEFAPPTYEALLSACCDELELQHSNVTKILKLPDILVKKDRDVQRLQHGQRIEVILNH